MVDHDSIYFIVITSLWTFAPPEEMIVKVPVFLKCPQLGLKVKEGSLV